MHPIAQVRRADIALEAACSSIIDSVSNEDLYPLVSAARAALTAYGEGTYEKPIADEHLAAFITRLEMAEACLRLGQ